MKKIYISSDHAGFKLKEQIKKKFAKKVNLIDLGANKSNKPVDYPNFAHLLCKKVSNNKKNIGIWFNNKGKMEKIAAIGIRVSKWIAYHGFCLNIKNDLNPYKKIIPCGISDKKVTSLSKISKVKFNKIEEILINKFISNLKNLNV